MSLVGGREITLTETFFNIDSFNTRTKIGGSTVPSKDPYPT